MSEYDDIIRCKKCDGFNEVIEKAFVQGHVSEAETICTSCGHEESPDEQIELGGEELERRYKERTK